jgi:polyphosphate:AMP phosphotransferase
MFEAIELGQTLSKGEFKQAEKEFRTELLQLQRQLSEVKIASLILIGGVEGAGKGEVVDNLNKWFDSRGLETHAFWDETDEETERPEYWRYWRRLPARGSIGVMFGSWYWKPIHMHGSGEMDEACLDDECYRIKALEHMLRIDGMLIVKLWFHISKKSYKVRIKQRSDASRHLRGREKKKSAYGYDDFIVAAERVISRTDTAESPWHLIEADDDCFRDMSVATAIKAAMQRRLDEHKLIERRADSHTPTVMHDESSTTVLDKIDNSLSMNKSEYRKQLKHYKSKLARLAWQAYDEKCSTVIVFEGWDAAGKGGSIRRITDPVDARLYRTISVAAPTDEELDHHYLWRFWRQIPRAGYMTVYDRSWYGRVLVERVEKFAHPDEWQRAYQEINDFEEQLVDSGIVLLKFWLHITQDEQLRRFEAREETPWKQYKLTGDDWRNRDKWDAYAQAVNEMVLRTSTGKAPWTLVPANNKYYARIEVMKTLCERLEEALKNR